MDQLQTGIDALALLRLHLAWGADEGLAEMPVDRLVARPVAAPVMVPVAAAAAPTPLRSTARTTSALVPVARAGLTRPAATQAAALAAACTTRAELQAAIAGFDGCALRDTATTTVFADGNPAARIMLVGEAPGAEEDRAGLPFVGASGQLLDRMLASIDLDRTQVLITNILPWRPPGNRAPSEAEIAACLPFVRRHIALVAPALVLLLGATSVRAMTGATQGIRRVRGTWQDLAIEGLNQPVPALATYHPAYLLRTPLAKREAWADLITFKERIRSCGITKS